MKTRKIRGGLFGSNTKEQIECIKKNINFINDTFKINNDDDDNNLMEGQYNKSCVILPKIGLFSSRKKYSYEEYRNDLLDLLTKQITKLLEHKHQSNIIHDPEYYIDNEDDETKYDDRVDNYDEDNEDNEDNEDKISYIINEIQPLLKEFNNTFKPLIDQIKHNNNQGKYYNYYNKNNNTKFKNNYDMFKKIYCDNKSQFFKEYFYLDTVYEDQINCIEKLIYTQFQSQEIYNQTKELIKKTEDITIKKKRNEILDMFIFFINEFESNKFKNLKNLLNDIIDYDNTGVYYINYNRVYNTDYESNYDIFNKILCDERRNIFKNFLQEDKTAIEEEREFQIEERESEIEEREPEIEEREPEIEKPQSRWWSWNRSKKGGKKQKKTHKNKNKTKRTL